MTALFGTAVLLVLVGLASFALVSVAVSLGWRCVARWLEDAHPFDRARAALVAGAAPIVVSAAVVAACLLPGFVGALGGFGDHCLGHPEHLHVCLVHPRFVMSVGLAALAGLACLGLARLGAPALRAWLQAMRRSQLLRLSPARVLAPDLREIESDRPFCFTSGFLRPTIWVSRALWRTLPEAQRAAALAHERAHVRRRDPLARAVVSLGTVGLWPSTRREILEQLFLASEQLCDEAAAAAVADRVLVAESLLAVERLCAGGLAHGLLAPEAAFGGSALPERIARLLDPPRGRPAHRAGWRIAGVLAGGALLLASLRLHHLVEHALEVLSVLS